MPKATVSQEPVRKELKTCPPDGFVLLRPLPYGQMLERRDNALKMSMEQHPNARPDDVRKVNLDMMQSITRAYEFKNCIVDHNLEDDKGVKLDFNNPMAFTFLDPKIGGEIEKLIDDMNQEEFDEEDFTKQSTSPSVTKEPERVVPMKNIEEMQPVGSK